MTSATATTFRHSVPASPITTTPSSPRVIRRCRASRSINSGSAGVRGTGELGAAFGDRVRDIGQRIAMRELGEQPFHRVGKRTAVACPALPPTAELRGWT